MIRFSVTLAVVLLSLPAVCADIYRWTDADGNLFFSDTPHDGAEKIEVGEIMTVPSQPVTQSSERETEKPKAVNYDSVTITSPANEQTFRNNESAVVRVSVTLIPPLQVRFGHMVQLLVNGQSTGDPGRRLSFSLTEVERGAHQLQAVVVGADGNVIERSPVSRFFVHKPSVANRAP